MYYLQSKHSVFQKEKLWYFRKGKPLETVERYMENAIVENLYMDIRVVLFAPK